MNQKQPEQNPHTEQAPKQDKEPGLTLKTHVKAGLGSMIYTAGAEFGTDAKK